MLNILHVWDQAGVACVLAKYQRKQGCQSKVIITSNADKFGIYDFYSKNNGGKDGIVDVVASPQDFADACIRRAESADVIHVHSRAEMVPLLRKEFGVSKTIVLHYHGTDIRGVKKYNLPHRSVASDVAVAAIYAVRRIRKRSANLQARKLADMVLVATPDLLELAPATSAAYIPNPVDIEHFQPTRRDPITGRSADQDRDKDGNGARALTFNTEVADLELIMRHFERCGLPYELEVYDRTKNPLRYRDMPAFLWKYRLYADIRYVNGKVLENLSKTALEALACGLKVIDYRGNVHAGLQPEHDPLNVTSRLEGIYDNLLENDKGEMKGRLRL